jgi:hypothetical protein
MIPVLLVLALPACGGKVVVEAGAGGSGSTTGVGGASSVASTSTGSGPSTTSGSGGAPSCTETHDTFSFDLATWDGKAFGCIQGPSDYEFSALVDFEDGKGFLGLDSCSPAADCTAQDSKLSITAPGIYTDIPMGTFVRVHVAVKLFQGGCSQFIQIKNLPSWDGMPNPIVAGEQLWFLGVDGGPGAFADTPLTATPVPLGCFPDAPMGCGGKDDYTLRFQPANAPDSPYVDVPMGKADSLNAALAGGFEYVSLHNLRSFSSGICDGPIDFAYWISHLTPTE